MAPPSRPSLTLKAAKKLEEGCGLILDNLDLALADRPTKFNVAYKLLGEVIDHLTAVKEMCDVGMGTYPSYPAVRETMIAAGNKIYEVKRSVEEVKGAMLLAPSDDIAAWKQFGIMLADYASQLRSVKFVPERKGKKEVPSNG